MKSLLYVISTFAVMVLPMILSAEIVDSLTFKGRKYYVDANTVGVSSNPRSEIWFREKRNASSLGDIKIAGLVGNPANFNDYLEKACLVKKEFDKNKGLLGCLSTVGSVFCAISTAPSGGVSALVCETTWYYAIDTGAADCLKLVSTSIAKHLDKEKEWKALMISLQIKNPKMSEALETAIDFMCDKVIEHRKSNLP